MMVFAHIGSYIRCKNHKTEESRKIMLCTFKVMLAVYFCAVLELTLFDGTFGRDITVFSRLHGSKELIILNTEQISFPLKHL